MTTAQAVETSVTVNNNSPIQDYVQPDDQTQPTFESAAKLQIIERLIEKTWARGWVILVVRTKWRNSRRYILIVSRRAIV